MIYEDPSRFSFLSFVSPQLDSSLCTIPAVLSLCFLLAFPPLVDAVVYEVESWYESEAYAGSLNVLAIVDIDGVHTKVQKIGELTVEEAELRGIEASPSNSEVIR